MTTSTSDTTLAAAPNNLIVGATGPPGRPLNAGPLAMMSRPAARAGKAKDFNGDARDEEALRHVVTHRMSMT